MSDANIGFVGGGNMGASLIGGLVATGTPPGTIWAFDPDTAKLADLTGRFGISAGSDNDEVASRCATVVLAVKPQVMHTVVQDLAPVLRTHRPLLVSIAAGVREAHVDGWAGGDMAIVRTMPNTPALVGCGATALFANERVDSDQRDRADAILRAVGITIWVDDESQLDAVTALSGSGPAYYFLLMEIMQATGEAMGLDADAARRLTLQTALGAARIANESDEPPSVLRERVTSPGGTTERALLTMREGGIDRVVADGIQGARQRSKELGDAFGD